MLLSRVIDLYMYSSEAMVPDVTLVMSNICQTLHLYDIYFSLWANDKLIFYFYLRKCVCYRVFLPSGTSVQDQS